MSEHVPAKVKLTGVLGHEHLGLALKSCLQQSTF